MERITRTGFFVEDHADALLVVLEKGVVGESYNIGGENECTNIDLVNMICEILDKDKKVLEDMEIKLFL